LASEIAEIVNARLMNGMRTSRLVTIRQRNGKITKITRQHGKTPTERKRVIRFDAGGRLILPAFIDSHVHLFGFGFRKYTADLSGCRTILEMQNRISAFLKSKKSNEDGEWVLGRGWDQDMLKEKRYPNKLDLDGLSETRPVMMVRICGHVAVLNSIALKLLKPSFARFSADKGLIHSDENGEPTGIIKEKALEEAWKRIGNPNEKQIARVFLEAQNEIETYGIAAMHVILDEGWIEQLRTLRRLDREKKIRIKLILFLPISALHEIELIQREALEVFLLGNKFEIVGFKAFADGSLGARTASLSEEYTDDQGNLGTLNYSLEQLADLSSRIKKLDLVFAVHAIGDKAVEIVLKGFQMARVRRRDGFRIEHCSVMRKDLMNKTRSATLSIQPIFCKTDYWISERLGEKRARFAYPFKSLLKNTKLIGGSDAPVDSIDPMKSIQGAISNRDKSERLSIEESVDLFTRTPAGIYRLTEKMGQVSTGYDCDLILLSTQKFDPNESKVEQLFIAGVPMVHE